MKRNNFIGFIFIFIGILGQTSDSFAQFKRELFGIDYAYIGKGDFKERGGVSFNKWEARITLPQRLKKDGAVLFHKISYANIHVGYESNYAVPDALEDFTTLGYSLGLSTPLKKKWRFTGILSPTISSNFESSIDFSDIRLFGMAIFTKPINSDQSLILSLGAMYSSTLGFPAPLPFASLMWKPNERWTYSIGFPRMEVNYQIGTGTRLGSNLVMMGENFTLSDPLEIPFPGQKIEKTKVDNVKLSNMALGIFWEQKIARRVQFKLSSGYTFRRIYEFSDGGNDIEFDLENNLFVKTGISLVF